MLAELAEYFLTPCPAKARKIGYLKESIAIRARHKRRREAWREHLESCRAIILDTARARPERGSALILGSGALLDIPVRELSLLFRRVVLADVVHPWAARRQVRNLKNVRLETADLTGVLAEVAARRLPPPKEPDLYLDQPWDMVVSANVLSQLPLLPVSYLASRGGNSHGELELFARRLQKEHLTWLDRFQGTVCLITDVCWRDGENRTNALPGINLPEPVKSWTWTIAPRGEIHPDRDVTHEVAAFIRS